MYKLAYSFTIELHDSLYYATREIGKLFETGFYLHNYALSYAFGFVADNYHTSTQIPKYAKQLTQLNKDGIYVLPAKPNFSTLSRETNFWAYARSEKYHKPTPSSKDTVTNLPLIGRALVLSAETQFSGIILSKKPLVLPHWIRLGKWLSKAEVINVEQHKVERKTGSTTCKFPLNPLDVLPKVKAQAYSVRNMPPVSLITDLNFVGDYFEIAANGQNQNIPALMEYCF